MENRVIYRIEYWSLIRCCVWFLETKMFWILVCDNKILFFFVKNRSAPPKFNGWNPENDEFTISESPFPGADFTGEPCLPAGGVYEKQTDQIWAAGFLKKKNKRAICELRRFFEVANAPISGFEAVWRIASGMTFIRAIMTKTKMVVSFYIWLTNSYFFQWLQVNMRKHWWTNSLFFSSAAPFVSEILNSTYSKDIFSTKENRGAAVCGSEFYVDPSPWLVGHLDPTGVELMILQRPWLKTFLPFVQSRGPGGVWSYDRWDIISCGVLKTPSTTNSYNGKRIIWRCISYQKMVIFHCHVSFLVITLKICGCWSITVPWTWNTTTKCIKAQEVDLSGHFWELMSENNVKHLRKTYLLNLVRMKIFDRYDLHVWHWFTLYFWHRLFDSYDYDLLSLKLT